MKDDLFNSKEKISRAVSAFTNLLNDEGWKILEQIWDKNIEIIKRQLEEGLGEDETKNDVDRLREKLALLRAVKNTPTSMIQKLTAGEPEQPSLDPFLTIDELKKARNESA